MSNYNECSSLVSTLLNLHHFLKWLAPLGFISSLEAGMPVIAISELATFRLSSLSFFLLVYLLCSFLIGKVWNALGKDFPFLPKMTFKKSLALVFLLGLAFHLVLVMIAGTRELMTPKAWTKKGTVYEITETVINHQQHLSIRRQKLEWLYQDLKNKAVLNDGKFPTEAGNGDSWLAIDGQRYVYIPSLQLKGKMKPIVIEPETYGHERFVLMNNGFIELLPYEAIRILVEENP